MGKSPYKQLTPGSFLLLDEKVEYLWERTNDKPGYGPYRYQHITSRRGNLLVEFVKELGSALLFPGASPLNILCMGLYSVGEAMEIADRMRENKPPEEVEPTNLMQKWAEEQDEKRMLKQHKSVSGSHLAIQR